MCVTGISIDILLEGVADRLRFQLEQQCLRTLTFVCVTGISLEVLLEEVANKLRFLFEHQCLRTFIFCVRDRNIHRRTVGSLADRLRF